MWFGWCGAIWYDLVSCGFDVLLRYDHLVVILHGLPTGGLPPSTPVVVEISAGVGYPFGARAVVVVKINRGVVTLWVVRVVVVVFC